MVSDINSGLYLIQDQTLENDTGNIAFEAKQLNVDEGQSISIVVTKTGNGASTVSYEVLPGSASLEDFVLTSGELQWASNDTQPQNIVLQTSNDALDEIIESVFIRLFDPKNAATLVNPSMTTVNIIDALHQGQIVFATDEVTVKETDGTVQIAVTRQGGSDGTVSVAYVLNSGTAIWVLMPMQLAELLNDCSCSSTINTHILRRRQLRLLVTYGFIIHRTHSQQHNK